NNGSSWQQSKNNSLSNMLFVGGDAAPDFSYVLGGAQDNGGNRATPTGSDFTKSNFTQIIGGDGGRTFVSQEDGGLTAYSTFFDVNMHKSSNGQGISWDNGGANIIIATGDPKNGMEQLLNEGTPVYMTYDVSEGEAS